MYVNYTLRMSGLTPRNKFTYYLRNTGYTSAFLFNYKQPRVYMVDQSIDIPRARAKQTLAFVPLLDGYQAILFSILLFSINAN